MKRIITLITVLAIAMSANAQNDPSVAVAPDGDGLNLNIAGFSVTLEGNDDSAGRKKNKGRLYSTNVFSVKCGMLRMTDSPYYGKWEGEGDFLNLSGKSYTLSIEPISWKVNLDRKMITWLLVGIGCTWDNYHFYNPVTLINNADMQLMPIHLENKLKHNKMDALYLGADLGLGIKLGKINLWANAAPEILCFSESRYKTADKTKHHSEIQGLNPVRLKVGVTMMVDWFGVYVDYGLNPIFKAGVGNDANMVAIGVKIGI